MRSNSSSSEVQARPQDASHAVRFTCGYVRSQTAAAACEVHLGLARPAYRWAVHTIETGLNAIQGGLIS